MWLGESALPGQVVASVYRATLTHASIDRDRLEAGCRHLLSAAALPRERQKGQTVVSYDLRPFLDGLEVDEAASLRMTLRHDPERGIGRPEEVIAALGEQIGVLLEPTTLVRERLLLAPPPAPAPQVPRTAQRGRPRHTNGPIR